MKQLKASFFDDTDEKARKQYKLWNKNCAHLQLKDIMIESSLLKKKTSQSSKQWKHKFYAISDRYLIQLKDDKLKGKSVPAKFLELTNKRVDKIKYEDKKSNAVFYGFRITHNLLCKEFYMESLEMTLKWFAILKINCIQTTFHTDYEAIKQLGKGSFARVYLAQGKQNARQVAIKAFEKEKIQEQVDRISIQKEIELLRTLNHPGIIKLIEVYENSGYIFLIKELLHGGELFQRILNHGVYKEKDAAKLMRNLFSALEYMHGKNIIHRDIKLENLVLKQKNNDTDICVTDFGLADFYNPKGDYLFKRCGTPGYCAPEILEDKIYDCKVDCFSAGVIMFIIITGCSPFFSEKYDEIVEKNLKCQVEYFNIDHKQSLKPEAIDLLKNLLEKNPHKRFTAAQALAHSWFQILEDKLPAKQTQEKESDMLQKPKAQMEKNYQLQITQQKHPTEEIKESTQDQATLKKQYAEDLGILNSPQVEFKSPYTSTPQQKFTFSEADSQNQDEIIETKQAVAQKKPSDNLQTPPSVNQKKDKTPAKSPVDKKK